MPAVRDMQQMYDMWMMLSGHNRQTDGAMAAQPVPEEKYITMPTDYAEPMVGSTFYFQFRKLESKNSSYDINIKLPYCAFCL